MIVQQISFTAYFNRLDNIESEETFKICITKLQTTQIYTRVRSHCRFTNR
jgi:hypothetical protein